MRHLRHRYELPVEPHDDRLDVTVTTVAIVLTVTAALSVVSIFLSGLLGAVSAFLVAVQ